MTKSIDNVPAEEQGMLDLGIPDIPQAAPKARKSARAEQHVGSETLGNDPTISQIDDRDLDAFMENWENSLLPDPPEVPGWHTFWASTTNKYDAIESRMRGGYQFVKPEDIPNFDAAHYTTRMNSGAYSGTVISVNEMVLMKCPKELFDRRMLKYHHSEPLGQQRSLVDNMRAISDKLGVSQMETPLEQGMLELEATANRAYQRPEFFKKTTR